MRSIIMLAVLLLAIAAPPAGHGAHRASARCARQPHPRPVRIVRSPQAPKQVRRVLVPAQ